MKYETFKEYIDKKMENLEIEALKTMAKSPERFIGSFRFLNPEEKINQFISQSKEIRFGKFLEDIFHIFFQDFGVVYLERKNEDNTLDFDHLFEYGNNVILIEQKIRDDHDSGKKRSNIENYSLKKEYIVNKYGDKNLLSCIWFVDDTLEKNKNYYISKIGSENLFYGKELISFLNKIDPNLKWKNIWNDFFEYLNRYKSERVVLKKDYLIEMNNKYNDWSDINSTDIYKLLSNDLIRDNFLNLFLDKKTLKTVFYNILVSSRGENKNKALRLLEEWNDKI